MDESIAERSDAIAVQVDDDEARDQGPNGIERLEEEAAAIGRGAYDAAGTPGPQDAEARRRGRKFQDGRLRDHIPIELTIVMRTDALDLAGVGVDQAEIQAEIVKWYSAGGGRPVRLPGGEEGPIRVAPQADRRQPPADRQGPFLPPGERGEIPLLHAAPIRRDHEDGRGPGCDVDIPVRQGNRRDNAGRIDVEDGKSPGAVQGQDQIPSSAPRDDIADGTAEVPHQGLAPGRARDVVEEFPDPRPAILVGGKEPGSLG